MFPSPPPHSPRTTLRWLLVALVILVLLFTSMIMTSREREVVTGAENVLSTILYPFQSAAGWVANRLRNSVEGAQELFHLRAENARLRQEVDELVAFRAANEQLTNENARLREEMDLRRRFTVQLLPAEVIVRTPALWFHEVIINKGERDGVRSGMAVINTKGVLGTVRTVTYTTATVQLLTDRGFRLMIRDANTQEDADLKGQGPDGVVADFVFNRDARIAPGDALVTGLATTIPPGLFVGTIAEVGMRENNLTRFARVQPGVDFNHLDFVQVVLAHAEPAGAREGGKP